MLFKVKNSLLKRIKLKLNCFFKKSPNMRHLLIKKNSSRKRRLSTAQKLIKFNFVLSKKFL